MLDLVSINVLQNFIKIFNLVKEIGPVSHFVQYFDLGKASADDKWYIAKPLAKSYQYQCVCKI